MSPKKEISIRKLYPPLLQDFSFGQRLIGEEQERLSGGYGILMTPTEKKHYEQFEFVSHYTVADVSNVFVKNRQHLKELIEETAGQ